MKELSIEEKAKRYDETVAIAKECITYIPDEAVKKYMLNMFPELKESDDERIREELIDFVNSRLAGFPQCEKYIAWLEKQVPCTYSYPVNQWHKVEEFPPKDPKHKGWSVKVIVINDAQYNIGFYDYKLKVWCVPGCINPYIINITHWQTFPELPKEGTSKVVRYDKKARNNTSVFNARRSKHRQRN